MQILSERWAGLDIGKDEVVACLWVPDLTCPRVRTPAHQAHWNGACPLGPSHASLDEFVLHGPKGGSASCRYVDLRVNVLDVVVGGLG